jgi:plasmid stabilization system protein ParE
LVEWTPYSRRRLSSRIGFLGKKNPRAAQDAVIAIFAASERLGAFPNIGRPYARSPKRYRELVVPFGSEGYTLLYEVLPSRIRILGVKHQREASY